jgi:hypothetical protein
MLVKPVDVILHHEFSAADEDRLSVRFMKVQLGRHFESLPGSKGHVSPVRYARLPECCSADRDIIGIRPHIVDHIPARVAGRAFDWSGSS